MGATVHRFLTGIACAVAVLAAIMAYTTQSRVNSQSNQLDRQRDVNTAISSALQAQRGLNADLARNLIRVMRIQQRSVVVPGAATRYLATR